jgi:hypothetical protein
VASTIPSDLLIAFLKPDDNQGQQNVFRWD